MERKDFEQALRRATSAAIEVARAKVVNHLSDRVRYWATIGFEEGREPPGDGDVLRKELSLPDGVHHGLWTAEQVVDYFWVAGTVPIWIRTAVCGLDDRATHVSLAGCVVFTDRADRVFDVDGCAPFGIWGPRPPRGWVRGQKFDIRTSQP